MNLELTDEEGQHYQTVREVAAGWAATLVPGFDRTVARAFGETGWGHWVPGNPAHSLTRLALSFEALGATPLPGPFGAINLHAALVLDLIGEQDLATRVRGGTAVVPFCQGSGLRVTPVGGRLEVTGGLPAVPYGQIADAVVVVAGLPPVIVVIERDSISTTRALPTMARDLAADLTIEEAPVSTWHPADDRLTPIFDVAVVAQAAELVGLAATALDRACERVRCRAQWGSPLASRQTVAHRCADLHLSVLTARDAVYDAAAQADRGIALSVPASMAKLLAVDAALQATAEAHQLWGGEGYFEDQGLGILFRRARALAPRLGDIRFHLDRIAELSDDRLEL